MEFSGNVGELGSARSVAYFELSWVGVGKEALKRFALEECRRKGLEVVNVVEGKKDEKDMVSVRVKSERGIV